MYAIVYKIDKQGEKTEISAHISRDAYTVIFDEKVILEVGEKILITRYYPEDF